jgi:nucleoside-diphosphate-sugar epimerase
MRVIVVGATGNVGTSVLHALAGEERVDHVVGVARRRPAMDWPKTSWVEADIARSDAALERVFEGADCVVHLGWLIQPSRDEATLYATNVDGSQHVFNATARAGVPALVYASSVGAYSPGPKDRAVDESWPTDGVRSSFYSRHKAAAERLLDSLEREHPSLRVVRLRPGLIFKREAATGIRRLFGGPFIPSPLVRPELIPVVPRIARLRFQAVHSLDVGDAYRRAIVSENARGAYNVAAEPVLDPDELGRILGARPVPLPESALRAGAELAWRLRLQPSPKGWVDMALNVPIMSTRRIREELGWQETRTSGAALLDLLAGMRDRSGADTPPLAPGTSGPLRLREFVTGVGRK